MKALQIKSSNGVLSDLDIIEVYEFFDKPVLFSSIDCEGIIFLSTFYDEIDDGIEQWLYSPISEETFRQLRSGQTDFHSAFLDSFYTHAFDILQNWNTKEIKIDIIRKVDILADTLPDVGQRLDENEIARLSHNFTQKNFKHATSTDDIKVDYFGRQITITDTPVFEFNGEKRQGNITKGLIADYLNSLHIDFPQSEIPWSEIFKFRSADLEFKFTGRRTAPSKWSLKSINQSSERMLSGFRILIDDEEAINDISIPYLKAGSIIYGISSRSSDRLLGEHDIKIYEALKNIQQVIDWIEGNGNKPDLPDIRLRDVLKSIEEMAPHEKDDFNEIHIKPKQDSIKSGVRPFNLSYRSRVAASERLQLLILREKENRVVKFRGNIDRIRKPSKKQKLGEIHMVDLEIRPNDWDSSTASVKFETSKLVDSLLAFTANSAEVTVVQSFIAGEWDKKTLKLISIRSIDNNID